LIFMPVYVPLATKVDVVWLDYRLVRSSLTSSLNSGSSLAAGQSLVALRFRRIRPDVDERVRVDAQLKFPG
jgi:hypothetical protein